MSGLYLDALMMCFNSYREKPSIFDSYTDVEVILKQNMFGTHWLTFRGSEHWRDWFYNLSFAPYRYHGRVYHRGFFLSYLSIRDQLLNAIEDIEELYIAGHSLGGALAQIASNDNSVYAGRKTKCIVYASPIAGADFHNTENLTNIRHPLDPITSIPFGFGYERQGRDILLPRKLYRCNPHSLDNYYRAMLDYK